MLSGQTTPWVFASHNSHKVREMQEILAAWATVEGLEAIGCGHDVVEDALTLEGNALLKVAHLRDVHGREGFADDTGLEVEALGGAPGVYSARWSGEGSEGNIRKLLAELERVGARGREARRARFRTVVASSIGGELWWVEGTVEGHIAEAPRGAGGFGYDPVFVPDGEERTFAELAASEKHAIGHRGRAARAFVARLHEVLGAASGG
jgi:XTP/dITP diphosphohydrolase